jgi:hypothetical protein
MLEHTLSSTNGTGAADPAHTRRVPWTVVVGFGVAGAQVCGRTRARIIEEAPALLPDVMVAVLEPSGWSVDDEIADRRLTQRELVEAVADATVSASRQEYRSDLAATRAVLERRFLEALNRFLGFDQQRDERRHRANVDLEPRAVRLLVTWSSGDPYGSTAGPIMLGAIQRMLSQQNQDVVSCLVLDMSLAEDLTEGDESVLVSRATANAVGCLADVHALACGTLSGRTLFSSTDELVQLDQCFYAERSGSGQMTSDLVLDVQAELISQIVISLPHRHPSEGVFLNNTHEAPWVVDVIDEGSRLALISVIGAHAEHLPLQVIRQYCTARLGERVIDVLLAPPPQPVAASASVDGQFDPIWGPLKSLADAAADQKGIPSGTREKEQALFNGLARFEPEEIEEQVLAESSRVIFDHAKVLERDLRDKHETVVQDFSAQLDQAVSACAHDVRAPLERADRLVARLSVQRGALAQTYANTRDRIPNSKPALEQLRYRVSQMPYTQAAYLWAGLFGLILLYFSFYSPALPLWWGDDLLALATTVAGGIALLAICVTLWLRDVRGHTAVALSGEDGVFDAVDEVVQAQTVHAERAAFKQTCDKIARVLEKYQGPDSPMARIRLRLERLQRTLAQDRLDCVISHDLVCSSIVRPGGGDSTESDLEAAWRRYGPHDDLNDVAADIVKLRDLGELMIDDEQYERWEAFEAALLNGCAAWVTKRLANVSVLSFLDERRDVYQRALLGLGRHSSLRTSARPNPNEVRSYLCIPEARGSSGEIVTRLTDGVHEMSRAANDLMVLPSRSELTVASLQLWPRTTLVQLPKVVSLCLAWAALDEQVREGAALTAIDDLLTASPALTGAGFGD